MPKQIIISITIAVVVISASIIILSSAGLLEFKKPNQPLAPNPTQPQIKADTLKSDPFFDTQTVTIQGEIVSVQGSTLSVKNSKGQASDFPISTSG